MLKPMDAWWTVLVIDPIAVRLTVWIARYTRLTPNAVTAIANLIGFLAGLAFLTGSLAAGAVLYQVAFLFDCVDGKLARYKGMSSPVGAFLDWILDRSMDVYAAITLAIGAFRRTGDVHVLVAGMVWLGLFSVRYLMVQRRHLLLGFGQEPQESIRVGLARKGFARRWMDLCRRHRLYPVPSNIEIFLATFTVFPLLHRPLWGFVAGAAAFAVLSATGLRTVVRELGRRASVADPGD
ncbi:CDP-alcohol phosphatidyltransferase family protein [Thermaerobacter composti]|uniref:CDP-alcohol phosphatidyltransferase family protein n=1 Tax=Thermaerobacter composti TaxID=554949 RepID=A0ABZ0QQB4_9FIRM|nr:CDP-alcohol phosphatidyltransferase family protein [Thermaerobacter composti]WPD19678.1 CDP-alcohol phosphatidyltransferase family protein [Thermaerobacter composti]